MTQGIEGMRLDAMLRHLSAAGRVKIFIVTNEFCMCCYVTRQQSAGEGEILVDVGASVRHDFATGAVAEERFRSGTLALNRSSRLTRRIQTHRRHLGQRSVPDVYFRLADRL